MIRISDAIEKILYEDGFVIEAMQRKILNNSAYAKEIHKRVETLTMKPVQLGTIVVALTRFSNNLQQSPEFNPKVNIDNFSVTSSLSEVSYERTQNTSEKASTLRNALVTNGDFFTITEGIHEITIVCSEQMRKSIIDHFDVEPKIVMDDLVAISVRFSDSYMDVPNTIYSLVGALATRNINLIEIVSTYTELTFVVFKREMEQTIQALNSYSQKK